MKKLMLFMLVAIIILLPIASMATDEVNWDAIVASGTEATETVTNEATIQSVPTAQVNWTEILSYVLYAALTAIATIITKYIIPWLKAVALAKTSKIENDKIKTGLNEAIDAVLTAVTCTNQTYVESLKDKDLFDAEAQKTAFNMSWATAQSLLTDAAKSALVSLYGGVDSWLEAKIEQTTNDLKKAPALLEVKTAVAAEE